MKILLTGASGYIGSHLLPCLLEEGHHVYVLIRHDKNLPISSNFETQVTFLQGDLLDKSSLPVLDGRIPIFWVAIPREKTAIFSFLLLI